MDREELAARLEAEAKLEQQWLEIMSYYAGQKDAGSQENAVSALSEVQELYGYIPREKLAEMAEALGVKESFLVQLVKLYPRFKKAPYRHCITVCTGARCGSNGASAVFDAVLKAAEAQGDGIFKIQMKECLKECGTAPNIKVDEDWYHGVKPEEIDSILGKY